MDLPLARRWGQATTELIPGEGAGDERALLVRVRRRICAVPLRHVLEVMRPLPVEPLAGTPAYVTGAAVIRGVPTPVVELGALLGAPEPASTTRLVSLKVVGGPIALAVDEVRGIAALDETVVGPVPALLRDVNAEAVAALGALDDRLLVVLHAARLIPDEVWSALAAARSSA